MKNGSLLDTFAEEIRHLGFHTYRAAEWYRGELFVHELLPASACLNSYSIAKVFTVTAAGLLYDRGLMSVEEKVAEIFRREFPEAHDPKWERMTVDHVLSHRAGFPSGFLDIDVQDRSEYGTDDFLQYLFRTRLACEPGEQWIYSDAAFYLLSRIITKKTGRLLDELLWREVFSPLGFQEAAWSKCPMGYPMGGYRPLHPHTGHGKAWRAVSSAGNLRRQTDSVRALDEARAGARLRALPRREKRRVRKRRDVRTNAGRISGGRARSRLAFPRRARSRPASGLAFPAYAVAPSASEPHLHFEHIIKRQRDARFVSLCVRYAEWLISDRISTRY